MSNIYKIKILIPEKQDKDELLKIISKLCKFGYQIVSVEKVM